MTYKPCCEKRESFSTDVGKSTHLYGWPPHSIALANDVEFRVRPRSGNLGAETTATTAANTSNGRTSAGTKNMFSVPWTEPSLYVIHKSLLSSIRRRVSDGIPPVLLTLFLKHEHYQRNQDSQSSLVPGRKCRIPGAAVLLFPPQCLEPPRNRSSGPWPLRCCFRRTCYSCCR